MSDEDREMLDPRTVYRVWHENGDFEGEFHEIRDAQVIAELCDCSTIQTVTVYPDGREYES